MEWLNVLIQGKSVSGIYALFAIGLSLSFGIMRLVNIAHGDLIILSCVCRACRYPANRIGSDSRPLSSCLSCLRSAMPYSAGC